MILEYFKTQNLYIYKDIQAIGMRISIIKSLTYPSNYLPIILAAILAKST